MIIQATLEHLHAAAKLFDAYRVFYEQTSDINAATQFIKERLGKKESIIYLHQLPNKSFSGYAQLFPLFTSVGLKRMWLLNDLFVDENHRGKGISKLLIDRCKQLAIETNANGLLLETATSNIIGNKLYPTVGFELDDKHNYYFWKNS